MARVFNFSAGPSTLPLPVLEQAQAELLDFRGTGMSVMEMSHRSEAFEGILAAAEADLRTLLGVPENYKVLFLQGGATLQFSMIPMAFLPEGGRAAYVSTGAWSVKAIESAQLVGATDVVWDGAADNYRDVPNAFPATPDAAYIHFTSNETIHGVEFPFDPMSDTKVVCDMSSDILSRPIDVARYSMVYAGAQKNMGPAGATVVIVSDAFLETQKKGLAPILDYRVHAKNGSMYNTPPTWSIYICGLVYRHLLETGGLEAADARRRAKADALYHAIDRSNGFYKGHAALGARSQMNVVFTLPSEELAKQFVKETTAAGLDGLKGHRSVGGCRASIYNAFPLEGCQELARFMGEFAAKHG